MRSEPSLLARLVLLPVRLFWSLVGIFLVVMFASFLGGFGWLVSPADGPVRFFHLFLGTIVGMLLIGVYTTRPGRIDRGALLAALAFAIPAVLASAAVDVVLASAVAGVALGHGLLAD